MNSFNKTGTKIRIDPESKRTFQSSPPKTSNGLRDSSSGARQFPSIGYFNSTSPSPFDIV
jgi:hypothetical protein